MTLNLLNRFNKSLLYKFIFYKHFYKFIFLHKPLCEKYKEHTLKIFGLYVCKSCMLLYSGFLLAFILILSSSKSIEFNKYFFLGVAGGIFTFAVSYPPVYKNFSRLTKDFIRFYDGVFLAALFAVSFKINIFLGVVSIVAFIIMRNTYNKKRPGSRICKGCSELAENKTCSGYLLQKHALLKIDEEYSQIITERLMKERILNYD